MTGRHIMLVGMMGAGKSTVGAECARRLDRPFVDIDELVEATSGRTVADIFSTDGEAGFRVLERAALADACAAPDPLVIAAGGGAVLDAENRRRARATAVVVWLRADPDELARRVAEPVPGRRPLLAGGDPRTEIERLLILRGDAYTESADVVVDTDGQTPGEVADTVLEEVARCAA
jgi:shikimate kinase